MIQKTDMQVPLSMVHELQQLVTDDKKLVLNEPTGDFFYDPWIIKPEYKNTVFESVLSVLPEHGEARIIKLISGESYYAHADIDDRYHMSILGNYSYLIDLDNRVMHSVPIDGCWYDMDAGLIHVASNFGEIYRYQLVVRQLLKHSTLTGMVNVSIQPNKTHNKLRYYFDNSISQWLNRANKKGLIDKFTVTEHGCSFLLEKSYVDELKSTVHVDYDVLIN